MKFYLYSILFSLILISCNINDDAGINCSLFDPGPQDIFVNLIGNKGENLIMDGTYDPGEIEVTANGEMAGSAIILDGGPRAFIYINKKVAGDQTNLRYLIKLNEGETDIMDVSYSIISVECGHKIYTAQKILYNDEEMEIGSVNQSQEIFVKKSR